MQRNTRFTTSRRWALGLLLAVLVALSAVYTPVVLQEVAGVNATTPAFACGPHSGGC
jgi:hypothetical protein